MNKPFSETAILDFDSYLSGLDPDRREGIQHYLDLVEEPKRPAAKQKLASMYAVHEATGLDLFDVRNQWEDIRAGFAENNSFSREARNDDGKFFLELHKRTAQQRDERHLLFGLDAQTPKAPAPFLEAAGRLGAQGLRVALGWGAKAEEEKVDPYTQAWRDSLTFRAQEAAYKGESYADALSTWQATAKGKPGYSPEREESYFMHAREVHGRLTDTLTKVRPIAERASEQIAKARGVEGGDGQIAPSALFRGLTPAEKDLAFRVMTDLAGDGPDKSDWSGFVQATGEAFGRGFENLAIGGNLAAFQSYLLRKKPFKAGDKVTERDAFSEVRTDFRAQFADDLNIGGMEQMLLREGVRAGKGRALTPGEAEAWNRHVAEFAEDVETVEQLREFGQQVVDPTNKSGGTFRRKFWLPVMDSAAVMAASGVGGWQGMMLNARSYQGQAFRQFRDEDMDAKEADRLSEATGFAQAALDRLQLGVLTKGLPATTRALKQFAMAGSVPARFAVNTAGTFGAEVSIEVMQDHVIPAFIQDNFASDPTFDIGWGDVLNEAAEALPDLAMGMVLLSAAGGAGQTYGQSRATRELIASPAAMRLRGYSLQQIDEIQAAPEEERGGLLARYLPVKAPEGEQRSALVQEAVTMAREEQKAAIVRKNAELRTAAEGADYAIRLSFGPEGWQVARADGGTVTVDSVEAAKRIRSDLLQAKTQQEAEALVSIIERWHESAPEGTTRETTITGEIARADGEKITYSRPGVGVTREVTNSGTLDGLREEARMEAEATGDQNIDVLVNGQNTLEFRERVGAAAREVVQRLELNASESVALTAVHEQAEAVWRTGIAQGTITMEETRRFVASVAGALDPEQARDASERSFRERVQRVARGEASDVEVRETVSELAVADVIGRRRDGSRMPAGSISASVDAMLDRATKAEEVKALGKFRAMLRAIRHYFRAVFGTVAAINKAKREGTLGEDWDGFMNKLLGVDQEAAFDQVAAEEAEAIANEAELEYLQPTEEEIAAGVAFSLAPSNPERDARLLQPVEIPETSLAGERADWRKAVREFIAANLQGRTLRNTDTGWDVGFNAESKSESVAKLNRETQFRAALSVVPIVENAVLLGSVQPDASRASNTEAFHYFAVPVRIGDRTAVAWFNIREPRQTPQPIHGRIFYEFGLYEKGVQTSPRLDTAFRQPDTSTSGPTDTIGGFLAAVKDTLPAALKVQGSTGFRISPGNRLELIQRQVDAALAKDPKKRRELARRAVEKLQALQFNWDSERIGPSGEKIRPVAEQRSVAELDKEQAVRQALRADELISEGMAGLSPEAMAALDQGREKLEDRPLIFAMLNDHGKLISKSTAARRGEFGEYDGAPWLPPSWYAGRGKGGLLPDQMAQALYDAGLLSEPSPDALWKALGNEVQSVRAANEAFANAWQAAKEIERRARNQAREEAAEWRREQDEMQAKDWSPRAAMVRDLQTYNALLSVFPPEIRGKAGGFVKLAQLGEKGRAAEIGKRIEKIGGLLERYLKAEALEEIASLFEKATPDAGENRVRKSKLGHEAQELVELARKAFAMDEDETARQVQALEAQMAVPGADGQALTPAQLSKVVEQWGVVMAFGNLEDRTAAEAEAARAWLADVIQSGRTQWRMQEEARLEQVRNQAEGLVSKLGEAAHSGLADSAQKAQKALSWLDALATSHFAFHQILRDVIGRNDATTERLAKLVRQANAGNERDLIAAVDRFRNTLSRALGFETFTIQARNAMDKQLDRMRQPVKNAVEKLEGRKVTQERVPIDLARKILAGEADGHNFTADDRRALQTELDALPGNSRKQWVTIERVLNEGVQAHVTMSPLQAMQFLLSWEQPDVRPRMERQGFTEQTAEQMRKLVSDDFAQVVMRHLRSEYAAGYDRLNPVYRRMFGMNMPRVANYAPVRYQTSMENGDLSPFGAAPNASGMSAGFVKSRVQHNAMIRQVDALTVFWQHSVQSIYWQNFAEVTRELRGVLGNPDVLNSIEQAAGIHKRKQIQTHMETIAIGGGNKAQGVEWVDKLLTPALAGQAIAALGMNFRTVMMQADAGLRFMLSLPGRAQVQGLKRLFSGQLSKSIHESWSSDTIQRRLEAGFSPEVRLLTSPSNVRPSMLLLMAEKSTVPLQLTDAALTSVSAAVVYDYHYREALGAGMDETQAQALAEDAMDQAVFETAQPASSAQRSLVEIGASASSLMRAYMLFRSDARLKFSLEYQALKSLKNEKAMSRGEAVRVLLVTRMFALLGQFLADLFKDGFTGEDDDEIWKWENYLRAFALGHVNGAFILGDALTMLADTVMGERYFKNTQNPFIEAIGNTEAVVEHPEQLVNISDPQEMVRAWKKATRALSVGGQHLAAPAAAVNAVATVAGIAENATEED